MGLISVFHLKGFNSGKLWYQVVKKASEMLIILYLSFWKKYCPLLNRFWTNEHCQKSWFLLFFVEENPIYRKFGVLLSTKIFGSPDDLAREVDSACNGHDLSARKVEMLKAKGDIANIASIVSLNEKIFTIWCAAIIFS